MAVASATSSPERWARRTASSAIAAAGATLRPFQQFADEPPRSARQIAAPRRRPATSNSESACSRSARVAPAGPFPAADESRPHKQTLRPDAGKTSRARSSADSMSGNPEPSRRCRGRRPQALRRAAARARRDPTWSAQVSAALRFGSSSAMARRDRSHAITFEARCRPLREAEHPARHAFARQLRRPAHVELSSANSRTVAKHSSRPPLRLSSCFATSAFNTSSVAPVTFSAAATDAPAETPRTAQTRVAPWRRGADDSTRSWSAESAGVLAGRARRRPATAAPDRGA